MREILTIRVKNLAVKMDTKKTFGATVREWRSQLGISQEKLAERANLHRTYVSDIERGERNVSLENIERLARALDISISTLFPQPESSGTENIAPGGNPSPSGKELVDVLLVEDCLDDVDLTLKAFKTARLSNHIHVIKDGAEALEYIFCTGEHVGRRIEDAPHIILLDLSLPKVSGLEVLRRLKTDRRTQNIPVVILTASKNDADIAACRQLGADNYIIKPVDMQRLSEATPSLNLDWALLKPRMAKSANNGA